MYKLVFLFFLSCSSYLGFSQTTLPNFSSCEYISQSDDMPTTYTLVLVARAGCDYSNDAIKELSTLSRMENLTILIYEFGDLSTIKFLYEEYFNSFSFIHANSCTFYSNDFSPVVFFYKNKSLLWKKEGWTKKQLKKIKRSIKS